MGFAQSRISRPAATAAVALLLLLAVSAVGAASYSAVRALRDPDFSHHPLGAGAAVLIVHFGPPGAMMDSMGDAPQDASVRIERPSGDLVAQRDSDTHHGMRFEVKEGTYRVTVRIGEVSGSVQADILGIIGLDAWVEDGQMRFEQDARHAGQHMALHEDDPHQSGGHGGMHDADERHGT